MDNAQVRLVVDRALAFHNIRDGRTFASVVSVTGVSLQQEKYTSAGGSTSFTSSTARAIQHGGDGGVTKANRLYSDI